ncbi:hypothetical protein PARPLA_00565 [Rhodobacteraceae bacterium THAF1]|uniref:DUF3035 domain-containing protein n=1 Tax=Palleronia sp. THAF1 TaxID=2587842 RepID=UPI000F3C8EE1|nr:DUF3035 domain-containing protein [Palleronia sp. THAF1]QFU09872.1 hypothetical protein FIU81_14435 [Palleronia sp. THAF1]VDC17225.1 hypothetical protein PARPLA_00565 [Rhodobacteraceae bacterium THAF1]
MGKISKLGACLLLAGLAACASGEPDLLRLSNDGPGPDEFAVLPNKPLEQPTDFSNLPAPTPGGANRTDQTPLSDAIAALGGRQGGATAPVQGPALIARATRFGVQPDIRAQLAAEDRAFREQNRGKFLERLFSTNTYFSAYERQELDQYIELERLRRAGVRTPAAPPEAVENN